MIWRTCASFSSLSATGTYSFCCICFVYNWIITKNTFRWKYSIRTLRIYIFTWITLSVFYKVSIITLSWNWSYTSICISWAWIYLSWIFKSSISFWNYWYILIFWNYSSSFRTTYRITLTSLTLRISFIS